MYLVRNLTSRTIILSDIRAEVGPYKILDLERIISRKDIEASSNLRDALTSKQIQFVKQTVVRLPGTEEPERVIVSEPKVIERTIEKRGLDERALKRLIREAIYDMNRQSTNDVDVEKAVTDAISNSMGSLLDSIKKMSGQENVSSEPDIDPKQLAEIQQRAIERMSEDIDTETIKTRKKIRIKNEQDINDLANEL
ncbi:MAG: hypothetical protein KAH23_06625 [Kiritimatiellae bacterium]|nr:hypothetical protein [Kiritimatiellia bacterium]